MNDILDMSRFIEAKSDQLNADDLIGAPRTITVTRVAGNDGDQPISIFYEGDNGKPFKPCKTIRRVLMGVWGRNAYEYVGRSMTIFRDDKVTFGGLETGGVRISHMSHIDKETIVVVMKSKGKKVGIKILPLQVEQQQKRQADPNAAEKWATDHIGFVQGSADLDRLQSVQADGSKAMAKLATANPELHQRVLGAYAKRFAELSPADEAPDDPFGLPPLEGRTDEQHGETHNDADLPLG